jgi:hypothetical protein
MLEDRQSWMGCVQACSQPLLATITHPADVHSLNAEIYGANA